jgi:hypothetical protein
MADFPRSLIEFQRRFPDEGACAAYLANNSSFRLALDRAIARLGTDADLFPPAQPRYVEDLVDSYEALLRKATGIAAPRPSGRGRFATRSAASADKSRIRQR